MNPTSTLPTAADANTGDDLNVDQPHQHPELGYQYDVNPYAAGAQDREALHNVLYTSTGDSAPTDPGIVSTVNTMETETVGATVSVPPAASVIPKELAANIADPEQVRQYMATHPNTSNEQRLAIIEAGLRAHNIQIAQPLVSDHGVGQLFLQAHEYGKDGPGSIALNEEGKPAEPYSRPVLRTKAEGAHEALAQLGVEDAQGQRDATRWLMEAGLLGSAEDVIAGVESHGWDTDRHESAMAETVNHYNKGGVVPALDQSPRAATQEQIAASAKYGSILGIPYGGLLYALNKLASGGAWNALRHMVGGLGKAAFVQKVAQIGATVGGGILGGILPFVAEQMDRRSAGKRRQESTDEAFALAALRAAAAGQEAHAVQQAEAELQRRQKQPDGDALGAAPPRFLNFFDRKQAMKDMHETVFKPKFLAPCTDNDQMAKELFAGLSDLQIYANLLEAAENSPERFLSEVPHNIHDPGIFEDPDRMAVARQELEDTREALVNGLRKYIAHGNNPAQPEISEMQNLFVEHLVDRFLPLHTLQRQQLWNIINFLSTRNSDRETNEQQKEMISIAEMMAGAVQEEQVIQRDDEATIPALTSSAIAGTIGAVSTYSLAGGSLLLSGGAALLPFAAFGGYLGLRKLLRTIKRNAGDKIGFGKDGMPAVGAIPATAAEKKLSAAAKATGKGAARVGHKAAFGRQERKRREAKIRQRITTLYGALTAAIAQHQQARDMLKTLEKQANDDDRTKLRDATEALQQARAALQDPFAVEWAAVADEFTTLDANSRTPEQETRYQELVQLHDLAEAAKEAAVIEEDGKPPNILRTDKAPGGATPAEGQVQKGWLAKTGSAVAKIFVPYEKRPVVGGLLTAGGLALFGANVVFALGTGLVLGTGGFIRSTFFSSEKKSSS
jgi:hypothetical protein